MPQVVIGVGSNIDHKKNIRQALECLTKAFGDILTSPVYKSAPRDDVNGAGYYLNLVASFHSALPVKSIKSSLRDIELLLLRERNTGLVTIDVDLLLYGDWVGRLNDSQVPHNDIEQCEFVLCPLADLLPNTIHPVIGESYAHLWQAFHSHLSLTPVVID